MLHFRGMTKDDMNKLSGVISQSDIIQGGRTARGLNSTHIFGEDSFETKEGTRYVNRDMRRGYIRLNATLVNYGLTGSPNGSSNLLMKVLDIKSKDFAALCNFQKVYDKLTGEFVAVNNIDSDDDLDRYLIQGEYFDWYIDQFDLKKHTIETLTRLITKEAGVSIEEKDLSEYSGTTNFFGNWYINRPLTDKQLQALIEYKRVHMIKSGDEKIVYLCNLDSKERIKSLLINNLVVIPPGMRPSAGIQHDQFTKKYSSVMKRNDDLATKRRNRCTLSEVISSYKALAKELGELLLASDKKKKNTKSITESLSGKHGRIRGNLLGKRKDYSGRSTIIVNPKLSIDECGIPEDMMPKLFRYHLIKGKSPSQADKIIKKSTQESVALLKKDGILKRVPVALNRAPTLHRLGFRAFYAVVSGTKSIEIHPLVCDGYNADFDGDQMAVHVPMSDEAIEECRELMLATRNLFVPANGKHTLMPKQEIIYGLNVATKEYPLNDKGRVFKTLDELVEEVLAHRVKVYETVAVQGYGKQTAGKHTLNYCLPERMRGTSVVVTKKTIEAIVDEVLDYGLEEYKRSLNRFVQIGFKIAKLYAPTCSILDVLDHPSLDKPFEEFHENMKELTELYALGFEEKANYELEYHREYSKVESKVERDIKVALGPNNGFLQLVESGARGSVSNLVQIYAYKGRIQKNSYENFNAIIESSFLEQLKPFEHFISAYGTRKGMIDKVQKTGDTGYANRLMYQAASDTFIRSDDCGTKVGLTIRITDITRHLKGEDDVKRLELAKETYAEILVGRYVAESDKMFSAVDKEKDASRLQRLKEESGIASKAYREEKARLEQQERVKMSLIANKLYIDKKLAKEIASSLRAITLRSPITCADQCCSKCYGVDLTIRGKAVKGFPAGFIAGQSIGEPATQLTMRTFHKGGVAGKADMTSDFDRFSAFIECSDITKKPGYDPIAWETGKVIIKELPNRLRVEIEGSKRFKELPKSAIIKKEVKRGEGMCTFEGDHDIKELLEHAGELEAKLYLTYAMYMTYLGKADINFKHFEVLVSSMALYYVANPGTRKDLKAGLFYSRNEILRGGHVDDLENNDVKAVGVEYYPRIKSVRSIQLLKNDPLSVIQMEYFTRGIGRALMLGLVSNHESEMSRLVLSMKPGQGTGYNPNYIRERKEAEAYVKGA